MNLYRFFVIILRPIVYIIFRLKVINKNSLPKNTGLILCCNHISILDPAFVTIGQTKRQIYYMGKAELLEIPVLGFLLKKIGVFGVRRGTGDSAALDKAKEIIESGKVLGIFPEGTRSKNGEPLRPRSGAAALALRTGADVLPAAIVCKGKVRPFCKITVVFGDIITNEQLGLKDDNPSTIKSATQIIMNKIISLREEYL